MSLIINTNPEKRLCEIPQQKKIKYYQQQICYYSTTYDVINSSAEMHLPPSNTIITLVDRVGSVINPFHVCRARAYAKKVPNENGKEDDGRC